jgi:transcriptional regulator with XRE-family HTH domain
MAGDARLGSVLRHMREDRGVSLKAAASALDTGRHATVSEIESGKRTASFAETARLAEFYGFTLSDVMAEMTGDAQPLDVVVALPRAEGALTESDRLAICRLERTVRDYRAVRALIES